MLKYVLLIGFVIGTGRAATLIATAQCGSTIVTNDAFASCNGPMTGAGADASVSVSPSSFAGGVSVDSGGPETSASATFDDEYVLTVTGGVGNGLFMPCMMAGASTSPPSTAGASASFGSVGVSSLPQQDIGNCLASFLFQFLPFTFGVPQTFELSASAHATGSLGEGDAGASFSKILFFDTAMNPLTGVDFTLVSVDVPEPATWLAPTLLGVILILRSKRSGILSGPTRGGRPVLRKPRSA